MIRHWLLNYFVHDFTPSRELRETLTVFLNALPSHILIKHSPRDQRIVKGLKRVVRRLKKVHYPRSSQHVQVISPPPPVFDEEQVRHMVHAKLKQSPLRRKTEGLIQKGMAVEDRHHGNVAFQDARTAEIVVIGSSDRSPLPPSTPQPHANLTATAAVNDHDHHLRPSPSMAIEMGHNDDPLSVAPLDTNDHGSKRNRNVSQNSIAKYATSAFARGRHHQQELQKAMVKESYLRRMEQQKRLMEQQQQVTHNETDQYCHPHDPQQSQPSSFISDASLESLVSPGTTDDERYDDDDEDDYETDDSDADYDEQEDALDHAHVSPPPPPPPNHHTTGNVSQQNNIIRAPSQRTSSQHRRSVYNAELSDISPLASPNGSGIQGSPADRAPGLTAPSNTYTPTATNPNRQLATPASSMDRDHSKGTPATARQPTQDSSPISNRRVSWNNNRLSRSFSENDQRKSGVDEPTVLVEEDLMVDSPASISPSKPLVVPTLQEQPTGEMNSKSKPQRKLSKRLIKAFRSAGNIRSGKTQPEMTAASSTAPSSHSSFSTPTYPRRQNSKHTSTRSSSHRQTDHDTAISSLPRQSSEINHFDDLRTSLDEILPPPLPIHSQQQQDKTDQHHQHSRIIELDIPRWGSSDITPSPTALFRSSMILEQRSHDLAQQLCLVEKWVLLQVDWEEMVHCRWTKMGDHSPVTDDYHKMDENGDILDDDHPMTATYYSRQTRQLQLMRGEQEGGVQQLIKRFNTACQWVSSEIVRTQALDERVLVIEKFIRLAQVKRETMCAFKLSDCFFTLHRNVKSIRTLLRLYRSYLGCNPPRCPDFERRGRG